MSGYNPNGTIISLSQPEVINAFQQLSIETEVIRRAIEIFYDIGSNSDNQKHTRKTRSIKGSRKTRCMFYCVFQSYNDLGAPVDPSYAADIVGLPRNEIDQAFTEYSPSGVMFIEPERMLRFYIHQINNIIVHTGVQYNVDVIEKEVKKIIHVCRSTHTGDEWIQNTAAKIVAIVAIYFYMNDIKGLEVGQNIQVFEQACYLSWACIRRYHEQFVHYYNIDQAEKQQASKIKLPFL